MFDPKTGIALGGMRKVSHQRHHDYASMLWRDLVPSKSRSETEARWGRKLFSVTFDLDNKVEGRRVR